MVDYTLKFESKRSQDLKEAQDELRRRMKKYSELLEKSWFYVKQVKNLNKEIFKNGLNYVSIGRVRPEIIDSIVERYPDFRDILSSESDIIFWKDRIRHTERHKKDFASEEDYEMCFRNIPDIINRPDFVSVHSNKDSISFVRRFSENVSVAVRLSSDGKLAYRTMYPLKDSQLNNYIKQGRAWKILDNWQQNVMGVIYIEKNK